MSPCTRAAAKESVLGLPPPPPPETGSGSGGGAGRFGAWRGQAGSGSGGAGGFGGGAGGFGEWERSRQGGGRNLSLLSSLILYSSYFALSFKRLSKV